MTKILSNEALHTDGEHGHEVAPHDVVGGDVGVQLVPAAKDVARFILKPHMH